VRINTLKPYLYKWPYFDLSKSSKWRSEDADWYVHEMPEDREEIAKDSRWPCFFPGPISIVTTSDGDKNALEKVVGACIVNRFPYIIALSFCNNRISDRHYERKVFMKSLENSGTVAVQFLPPGADLDNVMNKIANIPDEDCYKRIKSTGLSTFKAQTNDARIFNSAYLAYEAKLVTPGKDFYQNPIFKSPYTDLGSHRVYYLEITAIQMSEVIAAEKEYIYWRSLPDWIGKGEMESNKSRKSSSAIPEGYKKGYTPHYCFPSENTISFESDYVKDGLAVKLMPPLQKDHVEVDNDKARWPCFFPSPLGIVTSYAEDGTPNMMPCGSVTILNRHPLTIGICIAYANINERYAARATLDFVRRNGRFGCGIPYIDEMVVDGIWYTGNVSFAKDRDKVKISGLNVRKGENSPILTDLPIHYDCVVKDEIRLGTHILFLGEVTRIHVRKDVSENNPLEWFPWATVISRDVE
jgi:flavin reductase (DIM6/NTAB) family NADH-FMN oxidoreductase RutF